MNSLKRKEVIMPNHSQFGLIEFIKNFKNPLLTIDIIIIIIIGEVKQEVK